STTAARPTLRTRLAGSDRTAADRLFVTLDPAARMVAVGQHAPFILTDTVGFIRKLPTQLVAAFKATLEELAEADLLVHVVDASHPGVDEQMTAVDSLLDDLVLADRPTIVALNKVDRLEADAALGHLVARFNGVAISARTGQGVNTLLERIEQTFRPRVERMRLLIPYREGPALALCYDRGRVIERAELPAGIRVRAQGRG